MITTKKGDSVKFWLDSSCSFCKKEIKKINEYFKNLNTKEVYMNVFMRGENKGKKLPSIKLTPDYNSAGILTHWHINFIEEEEDE